MGNTASVTHGAWSERRVGPLADRIAAELLAAEGTPPYVRDPSYAPLVRNWARAEAIVAVLWAWLEEQDVETAMSEMTASEETEDREGGSVRRMMRSRRVASVLDMLHRHQTRAMHLATALGLTPLSRARLGADIAGAKLDVARYWAEQAAADKKAR